MLITLLVIAIGLLGLVTWLWRVAVREARRNGTLARQEMTGICVAAVDQTVRKNRSKERVLELLEKRGTLTNAEIREVLGVHRRSVVRYLNELEREGKLEQIGASGRFVTYRRK
jgi:predicted HTH transcriptional regulator